MPFARDAHEDSRVCEFYRANMQLARFSKVACDFIRHVHPACVQRATFIRSEKSRKPLKAQECRGKLPISSPFAGGSKHFSIHENIYPTHRRFRLRINPPDVPA